MGMLTLCSNSFIYQTIVSSFKQMSYNVSQTYNECNWNPINPFSQKLEYNETAHIKDNKLYIVNTLIYKFFVQLLQHLPSHEHNRLQGKLLFLQRHLLHSCVHLQEMSSLSLSTVMLGFSDQRGTYRLPAFFHPYCTRSRCPASGCRLDISSKQSIEACFSLDD